MPAGHAEDAVMPRWLDRIRSILSGNGASAEREWRSLERIRRADVAIAAAKGALRAVRGATDGYRSGDDALFGPRR